MRVIEKHGDSATVELTTRELTILSNAVNEVCNRPEAIEEWEFGTRIGASRQKAEDLLAALNSRPWVQGLAWASVLSPDEERLVFELRLVSIS
jgi:hypothetical protein